MAKKNDIFSVRSDLKVGGKTYKYYSLKSLEEKEIGQVSKLPFSIKVLLEAAVRNYDGKGTTEEHIRQLANWAVGAGKGKEVAFTPARIVLQDFTGVPAVVDLAAMRKAMADVGGDLDKINPLVPVDLVIDHSVMVDKFGTDDSLQFNMDLEFERNEERYKFLHSSYYDGAFGALLVYDLSRQNTFLGMKDWLSEMRSILPDNIPTTIIGNKSDLIPEIGQIIDKNEIEDYVKSKGCSYIETSAKTGDNVEAAFLELTNRMVKKMEAMLNNSKDNL